MTEIKKVLVVDDQPTVCESVRKILSRRGYVVQEAFSAEEAIEKIDKEPQTSFPQLVIADLMMPKVDGLELTRIIQERYPETGVVIITGYAGINSAVKAAKLGALDYLAKPFTPEELIEVTERAYAKLMEKLKKQSAASPVTREGKIAGSQKLDVDLPFDAAELQQQTSTLYVETVTSSDIPVAGTRISESFCPLGQMECKKYVKSGVCKGKCPIRAKQERESAAKKTALPPATQENIDVDLPFNAYEVAKMTSPEYVDILSRSDIPIAGRWQKVTPEEEKSRVLVVDDEVVVCNSVRKVLERRGYKVDEAHDPAEALNKIQQNSYNLVILDIKLPQTNGVEVLRSIRNQRPATKVIMITGYPSIQSAIETIQLGAADYLAKPFTPGELLAVTHAALELRGN